MTKKSLLKVLSLEYIPVTNSFSPHVRYLDSDNLLADMYKIIGCHCVTCTEIEINGKYFDFWSDDNALLVDCPVPCLYLNDDLIIFGNIIFAKCDKNGKTIGLNFDEIQLLYNFSLAQFPKLLSWFKNLKG